MSIFRRLLHPARRPNINHARDMAIFLYVERLKREDCTWTEAYGKAAASGRFDRINADQAEAVKTAYNRMKRRLRNSWILNMFDWEAIHAEEQAKRDRIEAMVTAALSRDRARLMTPDRRG